MPHFKDFVPQGVIPANLLAFHEDFSINEKETRRHLSFVAATDGITAITINGHASEVHACSFEDQQRLLAMAGDEIGDRMPLIGGIYADGSLEAAKLAKMHERGGASALLCFPPNSFGMGGIQRRPEMAFAHLQTIAAATDLPLIIFQYSNELAYDLDILVKLSEIIPSICAVKDWSPAQRHERNIRVLQNLSRPINVLTTNSAWLMSALSMGAKGLLSGAGSVIADRDTTFRLPEVSMGLVPGAGGTVSLPRRIGRHRTGWLALTGATVDAPTALAWGVVDELSTVAPAPPGPITPG